MVLSLPKCQIGEEVHILGWVRDADGIRPDPDKLKKLQEMERPRNVQEVQTFLGLVRFLADSTAHLDKVLTPLNQLTKKNRTFEWTEVEQKCFEEVKKLVANFVVRHVPDFDRDFHLYTDASQYGRGGFLGQPRDNGGYDVLFCFARAFSDIQSRYSVIEKECLAILTGLDRAAPYVADRHFTVYTDHRPLIWLVGKNNDASANGRLQRWIQRMARFDFEVVYIPGPKNVVADAFSRMGVPKPELVRDQGAADEDQPPPLVDDLDELDEHVLQTGVFASGDVDAAAVDREVEIRYVHGRPLVGDRFYVSAEQKAEFLRLAHDHPVAGHRGRDATLFNLRTVYWDGNMAEEVAAYGNECAQCQRAKWLPVPPCENRAWAPEDCCGRWHMDRGELARKATGTVCGVSLCGGLS
jgi:hypothetical protein